MPNQCTVCTQIDATVDVATGICDRCRSRLGVIPMPPSRRDPRPCGKCSCMRFVRVIPREHTATGNDYVNEVAAPMTVTQLVQTNPKLFSSGRNVEAPNIRMGAGLLEMFICTQCGFVEWYCADPLRIPIGPAYMSEYIDYGSSPPFR